MTGHQRITSALKGEWPDKRPIMLHNFMMAAHEAGMNMKEYRSNPEKAAKAHIEAVEKYDLDGVLIDFDTATLAAAVGVPVEDPVPRWFGYSTGRWIDDELVIETTGFTDLTWLDFTGNPHTESLHLTERFRRTAAGHLEIETTVNDPETYSQPFSYTMTATVLPDDDLLEFFCTDNEISSDHYQ